MELAHERYFLEIDVREEQLVIAAVDHGRTVGARKHADGVLGRKRVEGDRLRSERDTLAVIETEGGLQLGGMQVNNE